MYLYIRAKQEMVSGNRVDKMLIKKCSGFEGTKNEVVLVHYEMIIDNCPIMVFSRAAKFKMSV